MNYLVCKDIIIKDNAKMNLFYTPHVSGCEAELDEQDSRHAVRVLRMGAGDRLQFTDGRGVVYTAEIADPDPRRCGLRIVESRNVGTGRPYRLTMAVAPTKNPDRYEWFLEKATEVGCDTFIPILTEHGEKRGLKAERMRKILVSAMKQSLGAWLPELADPVDVKELIARPFEGVKLIPHCREGEKRGIGDIAAKGDDLLVLVGPEGDFSTGEIDLALGSGFCPVTLGQSRLRTETAALMCVMEAAFVNR